LFYINTIAHYKPVRFLIKVSTLLLFLAGILYSAAAQTKYGIVAGVGKTSLHNFAYSPSDYDSYWPQANFWAGATADVALVQDKLSFIIAATYNTKGYKYYKENKQAPGITIKDSAFSQSIKYVDVNISLRKKFVFAETNNFFVATGPQISILTGGKEKIQVNYFNNTYPQVNTTNAKLPKGNTPGSYNPAFISWGFSGGFQFTNIAVGVNVAIPLNNYYQDANDAVGHKIKSFGVSLAYTLYTHVKKDRTEKREKRQSRKTPEIPIAVDSTIDRDGDGIADVFDKCPGHKGSAKYLGCPIPDTDGDGVNDDMDSCINITGNIENHGCPKIIDAPKPKSIDTACYNVYFEPGKSILRSEAYNTLNIVLKQLKANPKLVAVFRGNTDNVGSAEANYKRSIGRASVCADYIASYFINKNRLSVIGLSNNAPAADLADPLLQWKNRRVEICVYEKK
jgi:outer membrane protein OmpA-like peptidoglycan-associated protein